MAKALFLHSLVWFHISPLTITVHAIEAMPTVTIEQGTLVGGKTKTENGFEYLEFLQIPYAKPPVGDLRFKSPQPPEQWKGERLADSVDKNKISYQFDRQEQTILGSEDCLYLNVNTPALPKISSKPLAVMVYIHGGGFVGGNGIIKKDNSPDFLIEHNVIVVTINYRLGAFGFLSLDIPEAAGNMGLKDQLMALKWVQNNIEHFGGDKGNVTVFGISAGSASIEYLMLTPQSQGLFHKAILQSGSTLNHWAINYDIKDLSIKVAHELGYAGPCNDDRRVYKYLMGQPTKVLAEVAINIPNMSGVNGTYFGFVPSIEKDFGNGEQLLTEYPYNLLKEGRFNKVPVIRGFCDSEGFLFMVLKPKNFDQFMEKKNFMDYWTYPLSPNDIADYSRRFTKLYYRPEGDQDTQERLAVDFFGDFDFTSGIMTSTRFMVEHGVPVYVYMFAYDGNFNYLKIMFNIQKKGAAHGDDSAYVMHTTFPMEIIATQSDILIRNRASSMWSTFAKTGNPTPNETLLLPVQWPLYNSNANEYLIFDKELQIRSAYESDRMAIFAEIYEKYQK